VFAIEIRNGQKISQHFASKVLGLPMNNRLAKSPRKEFCGFAQFFLLLLLSLFSTISVGEDVSFPYSTLVRDQGAVACPFADGVALGCSLPDSIMVGRTGPIPSSFVPRGLGVRDALFCSTCASRLTGMGVTETAGLGAAVSERDAPVLVGCGTDRSFRPSPASAPAACICSSVGATDFFSRDLRLVRAGAADSAGVCSDSEDGATCLGGSGFVS
jgi:hypothetical protein